MPEMTPAALTEEELIELDGFLLSDACDDETLTIDEVHGFLTAVQLVPESEALSRWLALIWGEPRFAGEAERQRMHELLERLAADIGATLARRLDFEPLVVEVEEEGAVIESYEGWCYGFMLGVEQHEALWEALPASEQGLLAPMAQIALLGDDDEQMMDEDEFTQWVELIPGAVMGLYAYWHER